MSTSLDAARYFIAAADADEGISHLKLQKLCAYAQGMSLAWLGRPLFNEELEAWPHGPVEPELYQRYKKFGPNPVEGGNMDVAHAREAFDDYHKLVLESVNEYYGRFSAWHLRELSHIDFPAKFGSGLVICKEAMQRAFENNVLVKKLNEAAALPKRPAEKYYSHQEIMRVLDSYLQ